MIGLRSGGAVFALTSALILTGCSGGSNGESMAATEPSAGSASAAPEQSASTSPTAAVVESPAAMVTVTVVSYQPGNILMEIDGSNSDACAMAVGSVTSGAGNGLVTLRVEGESSSRQAKFVASAGNGMQLPCSVEAVFPDVPAGAATYIATSGPYSETVTGGQLAATGNEIDLVPEEDAVDLEDLLAVDCLAGRVFALRILKDYSQFSGQGRGDDIWVEHRVKLTNNCGKPIKAVEYTSGFDDVFDERILNCTAKMSKAIGVGKSVVSPTNRGCLVSTYDEYFSNWDVANKGDLTTSVTAKKIIFKDGSKLDSGL